MEIEQYKKCSEVSRGIIKADIVFKNARIINVFTEEIIPGDVAVCNGIIAGIGDYSGDVEIDLHGKYLAPGLIDSHLHLESTLVTPGELINQAAQCGTTTFIVDPHESANVSGAMGIDYILQQTEDVPANVFVMMPSCVPATALDDNGCTFDAEAMRPYLDNPRILGLGEVMDYVSVVNADRAMHNKLRLFEGRVRDGHAPFLDEANLQAYALAGIATDHECCDYEYAMKERRNGMTVLIREGSAARNLEAIVKGIVSNNTSTDGFCFCTDDKHIEEIRRKGHINFSVSKAISLGIPPLKAVKMATINAAKCYGLRNLGAIAPGYQADMVVVENLENFTVNQVFYRGKEVLKDRKITIKPCPMELKQTIHIKDFCVDRLKMAAGKQEVIEMIPGQITTKAVMAELPGTDCFIPDEKYKKIAVVERHKDTGLVGVGAVTGFGITGGAIASSVSHDSHNIIVIGDNDKDIYKAVKELEKNGGGYVIIQNGQVEGLLDLPVMGLISDAGYEEVNDKLEQMILKAHSMGVPEEMEPFITLSFMALPVIPEIRITPRGIVRI